MYISARLARCPAHKIASLCGSPTSGSISRGPGTLCRRRRHRVLLLAPVEARRRVEAAARAILRHDRVLPRQLVLAGDHVLHEGVRAVHRAALDGGVPPVAELIDVVLDLPVDPRLAHEVGAHLGGYDLVGAPRRAMHDHLAVEVDDHPFAHRVEAAVRSAHAHVARNHQVLEGVRQVRAPPAVADRCRVARGADHDLRPLVRALARHLREHAVVADDQRKLAALRPLAHGDAQIAGLPRLDRDPRVKLAVVQLQVAVGVDDDPRVVRVAARVTLHDREAAPDRVRLACGLEPRDLWSVEIAHDRVIRRHRQTMEAVLREHHQVHRAEISARLADHFDDALGLRSELVWRGDCRQLKLHDADHDAIWALVQPAESAAAHLGHSLACSIAGSSRRAEL
mmetsp:Transcript_59310/g.152709  ORF Transcript_59310/g.152709 Transcript_59310/m.152709 type:complete len:397 (-) Transcript_59310:2-1192(-)